MPHADIIHRSRKPADTNAYLVGGGIGSLAAAVHLIHDAHVPPNQIHIIDSANIMGGSMDGSGNPEVGYLCRGGRMLNFSYRCTYKLLSMVPSLTDPNKTVKNEIDEFNAIPGNKSWAHARVVASTPTGPKALDVTTMGLSTKQRAAILRVAAMTDKQLGVKRLTDCFDEEFFKTKFWYMWATMFAFEPWHSAVEFHRYLRRFLHEFPRINSLAGIDRTPYNQYDSVILPIETYLKSKGVDFRYSTKVTSVSFAPVSSITVSALHFSSTASEAAGTIDIGHNDIVLITPGSMTACSLIGTDSTPAPPMPSVKDTLAAPDGAWALWDTLADPELNPNHYKEFGNPKNFYTRPQESNWFSWTTTFKDNTTFFDSMEKFSGNKAGTGALVTFKDSSWFMSVVLAHQPHFINQPENVQVFWGYGLFPLNVGDYIKKPMCECTGREIMQELLYHLKFPESPTLDNSITIPCMMPYITTQFLTRKLGDRPKVIPKGSTNLGLLGQYVEVERDTVFTVEYSIRCAQMAVKELMGLDKTLTKKIYMGEHDIGVMASAAKMLFT